MTCLSLSLLISQITIHPNVASVQILSRSCSLMTRPSDTSMDSNRFQRGYTTCVALAVISPSEIWKQNKGDNSKSVTLPEKDAITKFKPFKPFNLTEMIRKKIWSQNLGKSCTKVKILISLKTVIYK